MLKFCFNPQAIMERVRTQQLQALHAFADNPDKNFELVVSDKTYNMRYEVVEGSKLRFFVKQPLIGDDDLIVPSLTLNIGALLLPEAMHVDGSSATPFDDAPEPETYKTLGSKTISAKELQNIEKTLKSADIRKLLKV